MRMSMRLPILGVLSLGTAVPVFAHAQTASVSEVAGLFNIMAGFMFVAAFSVFVGGIITYFVHFGNQERLEGIKLMEWGVAILFVLVVLLGVAQFFQRHEAATNVITAAIVIIAVVAVAFMILTEPSASEKPGPRPPSGT